MGQDSPSTLQGTLRATLDILMGILLQDMLREKLDTRMDILTYAQQDIQGTHLERKLVILDTLPGTAPEKSLVDTLEDTPDDTLVYQG